MGKITSVDDSNAQMLSSNSELVLLLCTYLALEFKISIKKEALNVLIDFSQIGKSVQIWTTMQSNQVLKLMFYPNAFDNGNEESIYCFFEKTMEFLNKMPCQELQQSDAFNILINYFIVVVDLIVRNAFKMLVLYCFNSILN